MILFFAILTACGEKTKVTTKVEYVEVPVEYVSPPECIKNRFPVTFEKCGDKYCVDFENANRLIANVKMDRQCLKEYEEWSNEVCSLENFICH